MRKYAFFLLVIIIWGCLYVENTYSQTINPFFKLPAKGLLSIKRDSLANLKIDKPNVDANLIEKPIDPLTYYVGPGDVLRLTVLSSANLDYSIVISPDGRAVIPDVGVVDLKEKTLAQAEQIILEKAKKVFRADAVYLTIKDLRRFKVIVSGAVAKPGSAVVTGVERVSEAIEKVGGLLQDASLRKVYLKRESKTIEVDLLKYYLNGDLESNPTLLGGDYINVIPTNISETIRIEGEVSMPGLYEYKRSDSLSTLIRFAQGLLKSAYLDSVEFVSFKESSNQFDTKYLNLSGWAEKLNQNEPIEGDFPLFAGDRLYIRKIPNWNLDKFVILSGEVRYPGYYPINEGKDKIRDLVDKAGGFTEQASLDNAMMIRQAELKKEDPEMKRLYSLPPSEMSENERRYFQARVSEIRGIMSINFHKIMENEASADNIYLLDQDSIIIPKVNGFINVQGRVNNPGYVSFKPGYTYEQYIQLAGGYGFRADESATLVTKSKGQQYKAKDKNYVLEPGDYILVLPESETTFFEIFTTALTIATQLITIFGVVYSVIRLK